MSWCKEAIHYVLQNLKGLSSVNNSVFFFVIYCLFVLSTFRFTFFLAVTDIYRALKYLFHFQSFLKCTNTCFSIFFILFFGEEDVYLLHQNDI